MNNPAFFEIAIRREYGTDLTSVRQGATETMPFSELVPAGLKRLERDEKKGLIMEDGKRILSFRVATFQALVDRLRAMAGSKVATTILFGLGKEIGRTALNYSRDTVMSDNLVQVFDEIIRTRGWGRCLAIQKQDDRGAYVVTMSDCPLCYERKASEPMCDLMRGIVTGWIETFLGKKAQRSAETVCAATDQRGLCAFEILMVD